jgi:cystathionine beta-lyase/cystathionine gamma-synthase
LNGAAPEMDLIDLRSDTVTQPSVAMRTAMERAQVGDDQYGRLQERIAALLGKEAALFVPSGTMANQIGLKLLTRPGDEVVAGDEAHIVWHESGASAANSGVQFPVVGHGGIFDEAAVRNAYKPSLPWSKRIAVEVRFSYRRSAASCLPGTFSFETHPIRPFAWLDLYGPSWGQPGATMQQRLRSGANEGSP